MHLSVTKPFFCKHFLQHNMGVRKSKNTALDTERLCFKHRRVSLIKALTKPRAILVFRLEEVS